MENLLSKLGKAILEEIAPISAGTASSGLIGSEKDMPESLKIGR